MAASSIGDTSYVPPLPMEIIVKENIDAILREGTDDVETAIKLCLYCMKTQIFNDGNKRASVIFANHYLISKGQGLIVIPESHVPALKRLLVAYYEDRDKGEIVESMRATGLDVLNCREYSLLQNAKKFPKDSSRHLPLTRQVPAF